LAEIGLFKQAELVQAPIIYERDTSGRVTIMCSKGFPVTYTMDGTMPTSKSVLYSSPIVLTRGGLVQAGCVAPDGRFGMVASKYFAGLAPIGWKVVSIDHDQVDSTAGNAIDGNQATLWQTCSDAALPHQLTVDMGSLQRISGFAYLPRQDGSHDGVVDAYRFETSTNGRNWITNVSQGRFSNIENNPVLQEARFIPASAKFFRFTVLKALGPNHCFSAAEISVLPANEDGRR
jgi:alpha-L-fucosidase